MLHQPASKVANHPVLQRGSDVVVGEGCTKIVGIACPVSMAPVELDTGHRRHMDISDQAGGFDETRGREEIGGRRESLDGVATHEPSHGLRKN
jgi:hypothetical protein